MISLRRGVTGIEHTLFFSPQPMTITVAIEPADSLNPSDCETAVVPLTSGGEIDGDIDQALLQRVWEFVECNWQALLDYRDFKIDTGLLLRRLRKYAIEVIRDDEQQLVRTAVAIDPAKLLPEQLAEASTIIGRALSILDMQRAKIHHDLGGPEGRDFNDSGWRGKASAAQWIKAKERTQLQNMLGEIKRLRRAQNAKLSDERERSRDRRFIKLARPHLGEERFHELWQIINDENNEEQA